MKRLVFFLFFLSTVKAAWANGGPIDESGFTSSGSIRPQEREDVHLTHERLSVSVIKDYVSVDVVYTLNADAALNHVAYAFPMKVGMGDTGNPYKGSGLNDSVLGFQILDNGLLRPVAWSTEDRQLEYGCCDWWAVTHLDLHAGKNVLEVRYLAKPSFGDILIDGTSHPIFNERDFTYSFELAKNWGDSRPDIDIDLNICAILAEGGKDIQCTYKPTGCISNFSFKKVDLSKFEDFWLSYTRANPAMADYIEKKRSSQDEGLWEGSAPESLPEAHYPGIRSDNTYNYDWMNLFDGNPSSVWATHLNEHSLPMHLKFKGEYYIRGIGILNGCLSRADHFAENARIKSGKIRIKYGPKFASEQKESFKLPNRSYDKFDILHPYDFVDWICNLGDAFFGPIEVDLEIDEVYPGSKYQDLCISELILLR